MTQTTIERTKIDECNVTVDGDTSCLYYDEDHGWYCFGCKSYRCKHTRALSPKPERSVPHYVQMAEMVGGKHDGLR